MRTKCLVNLKTSIQIILLEELVHTLSKYYCELNPIERNWCHAMKVARQLSEQYYTCILVVRGSSNIRCCIIGDDKQILRTCCDYEMVYRSGCIGKDVEITVVTLT